MVYALIVACSIMDGNFYINTYRQYKRSSCLLIQLFDKLIMMTLLPAKLTYGDGVETENLYKVAFYVLKGGLLSCNR